MASLIVVLILSISPIINADEVFCTSSGACTCPSPDTSIGETCILNCAVEDRCKGSILTCRSGDPCYIRCEAKNTCSEHVIIRGLKATDLSINCVGDNACKDSITIACGTGDCHLHCDELTSCSQFGSINVAASKSFQCSGSCPPDGLIPLAFSPGPTLSPSQNPSKSPSNFPSVPPSKNPTSFPSTSPSNFPSKSPTTNPSKNPSTSPTNIPTSSPSMEPTIEPTMEPTVNPTSQPSSDPTLIPTHIPTKNPSTNPSIYPTSFPSKFPSKSPTNYPTFNPTNTPIVSPTISPTTLLPTNLPSISPSDFPSERPSESPSDVPSLSPSEYPSQNPSVEPTENPSQIPTSEPSEIPTGIPSTIPTFNPVVKQTPKPSTNPSQTRSTRTDTPSISQTASDILPTVAVTVMIKDSKEERNAIALITNANSTNWLLIMISSAAVCFICVACVKIMKWKYDKNKHKNDESDVVTQEMTLIHIKNNDNESDDEMDELAMDEDEYCVIFEEKPFGLVFTNKYDKKNLFIKEVVLNSFAHENNVMVGSKIIKFGNESVEGLGGKNIQKMFVNKFGKQLPLKITFRKPSEYLVTDDGSGSSLSNIKLMNVVMEKSDGGDDEMQKMSLIKDGESRSHM